MSDIKEKVFLAKAAGCVCVVWNRSLALQKANCEYINQNNPTSIPSLTYEKIMYLL